MSEFKSDYTFEIKYSYKKENAYTVINRLKGRLINKGFNIDETTINHNLRDVEHITFEGVKILESTDLKSLLDNIASANETLVYYDEECSLLDLTVNLGPNLDRFKAIATPL